MICLTGCQANHQDIVETPTAIIVKSEIESPPNHKTPNFTVEVVGFVPFGPNSFQEQLVPSNQLNPDGRPKIVGRIAPQILSDNVGTTWLRDGRHIVRVDDGHVVDLLSDENITNVISIVPLPDGFLVASLQDHSLGSSPFISDESRSISLTRLGSANQVIWHQPYPVLTEPPFKRRQLLLNTDGTPYIYIATKTTGQVWKVDIEHGLLELIFTFDSYQPKRVWVTQNRLYWWQYNADSKTRYWHTYHLVNRTNHVIKNSPLQNLFSYIRTPLLDGGALLGNSELIWMGANGLEQKRLSKSELEQAIWLESSGLRTLVLSRVLLQPDGTFLLVGTDDDGIYVVRLTMSN